MTLHKLLKCLLSVFQSIKWGKWAARIWHHRFWSIFKLFLRKALKWPQSSIIISVSLSLFKKLSSDWNSKFFTTWAQFPSLPAFVRHGFLLPLPHPAVIPLFNSGSLSTWSLQPGTLNPPHCCLTASIWLGSQAGVIHSVSIRIGKVHVCSLVYCQYDLGRLLILSTSPYSSLRWANTLYPTILWGLNEITHYHTELRMGTKYTWVPTS